MQKLKMKIKQKIYNLLRWSQKYTGTDMIYLAKGGFWLSLRQIIFSVLSFSSAIAFANLLPKEAYGTYRYVLSLVSILAISTLGGMNNAIVQAVAQGYEGSFIPALKARLRWGTLGGLTSLGIAVYYLLNGNNTLSICFLIVAIFLPAMNSFDIYESLWAGKKRFDIQNKYKITVQVLSVATLITTLFLTNNIFLILLAFFVPYTLFRFIFLQITLKKIHLNEKQSPETVSYGKHLSLMGAMKVIAGYLDRVFIWHFLGPASVAIYSFATTPPQEIGGILRNISFLALPKFSQRTKEELKMTLLSKIFKLFFLVIPLMGIYIFLAPYLYKIMFPQYLDSIHYSQIFAISFIPLAGITLLSTSLLAQMRKKELYIAKSTPPIIRILLFLILIPLYGIWGAIFAILISEFLKFGLLLFLFKKI